MKNLLTVALALLLLAPACPTDDEAPEPQALSAVVMNDGGELLYALDADRMLPIASTTKLMTALVAAERCDMDATVEIGADCCAIEGSSMYLKPGERYTVRELLTGLLLVSGNDAALALAGYCAGDVTTFCGWMNEKAAELAMTNSHFTNPHGLNEAGHYSTARDLALLMRAVMDEPELAAILAEESAVVQDRVLVNHNKLLRIYEGCVGGKTGYTEVAGRCLVSCAARGDTRLICVTLSDPDEWNDHIRLYDWAFARYETLVLSPDTISFELPVLSGATETVRLIPEEERRVLVSKAAERSISEEIPFFVFAPVRAGAYAGKLTLSVDGSPLVELPLVFAESVSVS